MMYRSKKNGGGKIGGKIGGNLTTEVTTGVVSTTGVTTYHLSYHHKLPPGYVYLLHRLITNGGKVVTYYSQKHKYSIVRGRTGKIRGKTGGLGGAEGTVTAQLSFCRFLLTTLPPRGSRVQKTNERGFYGQ